MAVSIEPFRGDFEDLHRMAVTSWRDEYGRASFPDLFREEFLKYHVADAPPDHLFAAYDGDACVSFVAILPRTLVWRGRPLKGALAGLLTSKKEHLRRGIAQEMIERAIGLNEKHRYDVVLFYLETGHRSTKLFRKLRAKGHAIEPLRRIAPWIRVLDLARVEKAERLGTVERMGLRLLSVAAAPSDAPIAGLRPYRPEDLADCVRLLNRHAGRHDLARSFTAEEAARTLDHGDVARTLVVEREGRVVALLNWITHVHLGEEPTPWAWVSHAIDDALPTAEKRALYAGFLRHVKNAGAGGAVEFGMGYHGALPLLRNRFFPWPRTVTLYAWVLRPGLRIGRIRTFFDVQV